MSDNLHSELQSIQDDLDNLSRLVDFWHERAWPENVRRCKHKHATMVQRDGAMGWFVTWQCDDCGAPLNDRPVTADDLDHGRELPHFDDNLYRQGIERLERANVTTLSFFDRAVRR